MADHEWLREARHKLGLSVADFARLLDTDPVSMRRMEMSPDRSSARPLPPRARRLVEAYLAGYRPADWSKEPAPTLNAAAPAKAVARVYVRRADGRVDGLTYFDDMAAARAALRAVLDAPETDFDRASVATLAPCGKNTTAPIRVRLDKPAARAGASVALAAVAAAGRARPSLRGES